MGRLKGHMVYKVIATEFLPLREQVLRDPDEDTYNSLVKNLLKTGPMYFSYSLDITNSFQRQAHSDLSAPLWRRTDDRFFWNRFIQSDLINFCNGGGRGSGAHHPLRQQPGANPFILPVIFGMMKISSTRIKSTPFTFTLITRRSRYRAGTRYFSRGIDAEGHVSNYNETEQIVILNDNSEGLGGFAGGGGMQNSRVGKDGPEIQIMAYVQTRGSIPVYWAELNTLRYTPTLLVRSVESAVDAARKHFHEQVQLYGENYLVNLVNQRGREEKVKKAYEQMVQALVTSPTESEQSDRYTSEKIHTVESSRNQTGFDRLHYVYFDFHNETKGLQWHHALKLLEHLKKGLMQGGYFRAVDMPGDMEGHMDMRYEQSAVVRTNCMDCLDRTNVVQTMLGRFAIDRQLTDVGVLQPGETADDDPDFRNLFRNVWADNADVVSKSYSGSGALKTDFTRTGERTRRGAFQDLNNSITRYVRNNFLDGPRQDGFDVFLGVYSPSSYIGGSLLFVDRRPAFVQSVPYVLAASCFMVLVATITRQLPNATIWPMRIFTIVWVVIGLWAWRFIFAHGMLYVSSWNRREDVEALRIANSVL
jgi:hypothetical protein